jgi:hypothetical protein
MTSEERSEKVGDQFARFIRNQAPSSRGPIRPPATIDGWDQRLAEVKEGLRRSFGRMPDEAPPLDPNILGTIHRDGYAIDRLVFQSRPGVLVTANLYRPEPSVGRCPALLSVHGHWAWARMDPHVQPRCIALAKMGYVVLCVDAFGSGERAVEPAAGTYHGALVGGSLWPVGKPLIGPRSTTIAAPSTTSSPGTTWTRPGSRSPGPRGEATRRFTPARPTTG